MYYKALKFLLLISVSLFFSGFLPPQMDTEKALPWLLKAAINGNADAQFELGSIYDRGDGVGQSYPTAIKWYEKSASQGNKYAQNNLGYIYHFGKGVSKDYKKAIKLYNQAISQNYDKAKYNLAQMYIFGNGVKINKQKAVKLYEEASAQGNMKAQYNLGSMYLNGEFVKQDSKKAFTYFEKSANQGYAVAQYQLAVMYKEGTVVKKDQQRANKLFEKSALNGYDEALLYVGSRYYNGNDGFEEDIDKAYDFLTKAAILNNVVAQMNLGMIYYNDQNNKESMKWLKLAIKNGKTEAYCYLVAPLIDSNNTKETKQLAKQYIEKAYKIGKFKSCQKMWNKYKLYDY
jgi:TPR repeat protein